jgi:Ca2+-binding EF-hand superfamily protein
VAARSFHASPPASITATATATANNAHRKYPQFQQSEIFGLQDAFRKLDLDDKGYLDEATVIKATQQSEHQPYDVVRQALKEVELDSSRRVELDDYVDVSIVLLIWTLRLGIEVNL